MSSSTVIVVDTNILVGSPLLSSDAWQSILANRESWNVQIVVPDVVEMETVTVVRRRWRQERQALDRLRIGVFGLSETQRDMLARIDQRIDGYDTELRERLHGIGASTISSQSLDVLEVARRASERRAPYVDNRTQQEKNTKAPSVKDGFRDTLIWLGVIDIAKQHPDCDVWFVSNNSQDFGVRADRRDSDDDGCPYPLHTDLADDLASAGLDQRVFYVRTLERLEQHLASLFASVPEDMRSEMVENIDRDSLSRKLAHEILEIELSPRDTGLPLSTRAASLRSFRITPETLRLTDAARRAASTWTAQFVVTIEARIDIFSHTGELTSMVKSLNVVGRISLSSTGEVDDISVSSIASSPDDPMRQLWDRQTLIDSLRAPLSAFQTVADQLRGTLGPDSEFQATMDRVRGVLSDADVQAVADRLRGTVVSDPDYQATLDRARGAMPDADTQAAIDHARGAVLPDSEVLAAADRARGAISDSQLQQAREAADRFRDL